MPEKSDDHNDLDKRFGAIYNQLHRLAAALSRSKPTSTLNPTALVNEAYVKLAASKEFANTSELHFKRIAAHVMRQVLCDAARRKLSAKRGGQIAVRVTLDDDLQQNVLSVEQIIVIDDLLEQLRAMSPRQAAVVEYRFYGGLSDEEISAELDISKPTVERDWRAARAWLGSQLINKYSS